MHAAAHGVGQHFRRSAIRHVHDVDFRGELEELAGPAVYLASGLITGEILRVDGGMLASGVNAVPSRPGA